MGNDGMAGPGSTVTVPLDVLEPHADWTGGPEVASGSEIAEIMGGLREAEQGIDPIMEVVNELWAISGRMVGKLTGDDCERGSRPGLGECNKPDSVCEEIRQRLDRIHQALSHEHSQLASLRDFLAKAEECLFGTVDAEVAPVQEAQPEELKQPAGEGGHVVVEDFVAPRSTGTP